MRSSNYCHKSRSNIHLSFNKTTGHIIMKTKSTLRKLLNTARLMTMVTALTFASIAQAERDEFASLSQVNGDEEPTANPHSFPTGGGRHSSWSIAYENDVLVPGSRDQDYTFGLNITFAGASSEDHWASLHGGVDWLTLLSPPSEKNPVVTISRAPSLFRSPSITALGWRPTSIGESSLAVS